VLTAVRRDLTGLVTNDCWKLAADRSRVLTGTDP